MKFVPKDYILGRTATLAELPYLPFYVQKDCEQQRLFHLQDASDGFDLLPTHDE